MIEKIINIAIVCFTVIVLYRFAFLIVSNRNQYLAPYYTERYYKQLEAAFDSSQYRKVDHPGIIPDETVYSYAAGAYLRGMDPILVNSERTPLGKYILALSIILLKNDKFIIVPFGIATLVLVWLLSRQIIGDKYFALLPVALFSNEILFLNQFRYMPLLDILHLSFLLLALYFFIRADPKGSHVWTSVAIGLAAATKTVYSAILLVSVFSLSIFYQKNPRKLFRFALTLPIALIILLLSYSRTFLNGYTVMDFVGFQKWILLYDKSKLLFPFSIWRLVFFNQWQTWWGDFRILPAVDWQWSWPVFTLLTCLFVVLLVAKQIKRTSAAVTMSLWFLVYALYISLGVASSRFLFPILPPMYILGSFIIWRGVKGSSD